MSSSADWYARKLGGNAAPSTYTPTTAPNYPSGPAAPPHLAPVPPSSTPQVTGENIAAVAGLWKGGQATKTETTRCPHCNSDHFFSISNAPGSRIATQSGMASAAPRCYSCGYTTRHGMQTGAQ